MPVYFLAQSIIYISSVNSLKIKNIFCFDKSKLLSSSIIDIIFFCKSGILCDNNLEINGYHPAYINPHKSNKICYKSYNISQYKEMNQQLLKYYQDYIIRYKNINNNDNLRNSLRGDLKRLKADKINKESYEYEYTCLFLECLLSCHNLEKYNTEFFGNPIEKNIFLNFKWNIKPYNYNDYKAKDNNSIDDLSYSNQIIEEKKIFYENKYLINKNINDIFPNNYYKMTESIKDILKAKKKPLLSRLSSKFYFQQSGKCKSQNENYPNNINFIKNNIAKSHVKTYKLRIYKRFIIEGTLNSSAIVYNFVTKELRFMTKGIPEDIINKCDSNSLPYNINNIINLYRRMGFIIIVCASKLLNIDDYKDSNSIEDYMNDITFCGFITLKYKLKNEIINSIYDLKQYNSNFIIISGDNLYNNLSVGFSSNIILDKNIFSFDKDEKKKLIITNIYRSKKENEEEEEKEKAKEEKSLNASYDKYSKKNLKYF